MKKVLLFVTMLGLVASALAQTGPPPPPPTKQGPPTMGQQGEETSPDWEHPKSIKLLTKMKDEEQFKKVEAAYQEMLEFNKKLNRKELGDLEYFRKQMESREKYRKDLKEILTAEQYKLYKAELDKRTPYELDAAEAAGLAMLSADYREKARNIQSNPNLSPEEKKKQLNDEMLSFLQKFTDLVKGKKKEKMQLAVKQFLEQMEKEKAEKEKAEGGDAAAGGG